MVRAFPREGPLIRLAGAILIDISKEWLRYLDMKECIL